MEHKDDPETIVQAVAERLSFFMSDANIRQDRFIRKFLLKDDGEYPNQIPVETLLRFNTIKQNTTDPEVVAKAAKLLPDILTVSEDGKAIGRVNKFTLSQMDDNIPLTLYISDIPLDKDGKKYECSPEDLRKLFEPYGKVTIVKLKFKKADGGKDSSSRRTNEPLGSANVEFETIEDMEKAAAETLTKDGEWNIVEPKKKLVINDQELSVARLQDYIELKKKRKERGEDHEDNSDEEKEKEKESKEFTIDWKPGCVIRIKGVGANCDREAILDAVATGLDISQDQMNELRIYADFSRGQTDGAIRFSEPSDSVARLCEKFSSGELHIAGEKVESAFVLEGEQEEKYWSDFIEFKNKQMRLKEAQKSSRKRQRRN